VDEVQYQENCTLRGAPGTVVEVVGEIHFMQNAWLEGSLRFVKAKGNQKTPLPMQHRCLDVEGSLEFLDPDVEFVDCGSDSTDDDPEQWPCSGARLKCQVGSGSLCWW